MASCMASTVTAFSASRAVGARKASVGTQIKAALPPLRALRQRRAVIVATMGGGGGPKISREEEPEEYWKSKGEAAGESPLKDPLAIIGIVSILLPFILTLIAIATGLIELPA